MTDSDHYDIDKIRKTKVAFNRALRVAADNGLIIKLEVKNGDVDWPTVRHGSDAPYVKVTKCTRRSNERQDEQP